MDVADDWTCTGRVITRTLLWSIIRHFRFGLAFSAVTCDIYSVLFTCVKELAKQLRAAASDHSI